MSQSKWTTLAGIVVAVAGYALTRLVNAHIGGPELAMVGAVVAALGKALGDSGSAS